ncbi:iron donor protein CyaY [Massilia sp. W12]|uniref:iron donor protein CyaY n=1 Tax=Massilia sp. W12 TaxID=3126507 RepID=UPI0030D47370
MGESDFLRLAEQTLQRIEDALDAQHEVLDVECTRNGNVMELEFLDNGSKVIINIQSAMQELWVAARSGGFHFRHEGSSWQDTREHGELFGMLSRIVSEQGGVNVQLAA